MLDRFRPILKVALASVALGAIVPLTACNKAVPEQASYSPSLPDLPATLPLALGNERPVAYAPPAKALPRARPIKAARIADPDDYYGYADNAWSYYDALGDAPPDYGFYYDDVEPWAWQGYDDSLMFVEPLDAGYRYYYYRPGAQYPYFIRDPEWGYGYDDGSLAVVYAADGRVLPYDDYYDGPWLDYASRYYDRGYRLYHASRARHPVIAANWYDVQPAYAVAFLDWEDDMWRQPNWWNYHERTGDRRDRYWRDERARRDADAIRYAAWQDQGFQAAAPPRAIPSNWQRADWARDERRFAPAVAGFEGNDVARQRAVQREQQRIASLARPSDRRDQVQLAALRERVQRRPEIDSLRMDRMAERRRQLEDRQVQLASRDDRSSRGERMVLQRQEQALARAQQVELRRDRGAETRRLAGFDRGQVREGVLESRASVTREQRLNQSERRGQQFQPGDDRQQWQQALAGSRKQRAEQGAQVQQRPQAQVEARGQGQWRQAPQVEAEQRRQAEVQARAETQQQRQIRVEAQAQGQRRQESQAQARAENEQRRQAEVQARAEAQQRRQAQAEVRQQRDSQTRQGAEQWRAAQEQARRQRAQAEAQTNAGNAQRELARQAAQQQRAQAEAIANARNVQREQARQVAEQQRAQAGAQESARNAQREQMRQAAEQRRAQAEGQANARNAQREQARQAAEQQRAQSAAQANAGNAQREQMRQAAEQQRATREQESQAAQQQRALRQQQAGAEAQARQQRTVEAVAAQPNNGKADKERRGRGQN